MVAHPRVLTQRTPVLRSGDILSLLGALLGTLLGAALCGLLRAALLCSCHIVLLLSLNFTSYTRYCSVTTLVYYRKCYTTYCCIYLLRGFLSTFFFAKKRNKTAEHYPILEIGYQSQFQDHRRPATCARLR